MWTCGSRTLPGDFGRSLMSLHGSIPLFARPRASLPAALPLLLAACACSGGGQGQTSAGGAPPGIPVKVQVAQSSSVKETTEYVATLKSRDSAVVMPEVEGQITQIYVHSGDHVSAGTPLMQIDPRKQEATCQQPGTDARGARSQRRSGATAVRRAPAASTKPES